MCMSTATHSLWDVSTGCLGQGGPSANLPIGATACGTVPRAATPTVLELPTLMQLQSGHQPCFGWCPADSGLQAAAWPLIFLDQNMLFQESERSSAEDKDASV